MILSPAGCDYGMSVVLTGGLGRGVGAPGATFCARTGLASSYPQLHSHPPCSILKGGRRTQGVTGNCETACSAINLSDELCHLGRGQRPNLSSCLETQFMVLTKFKIHLGRNRHVNGTEFSTFSTPHLFSELFLKHQSANRYVQRTCYMGSISLGAVKRQILQANAWVPPARGFIPLGDCECHFYF